MRGFESRRGLTEHCASSAAGRERRSDVRSADRTARRCATRTARRRGETCGGDPLRPQLVYICMTPGWRNGLRRRLKIFDRKVCGFESHPRHYGYKTEM